MSCEDEFELNYIKIDSKDEIKLLETDDSVAEISNLFTKVGDFVDKKLSKNIIKDLEKNIPQNSELFRYNLDFSKKFSKIINLDKRKNFNESVKRILSIDFENEFIFNYTNIYDVCSIICLFFSDYKKYKISSIDDIKNIIKKIHLQQYDFYRLYTDFSSMRRKTVPYNKTKIKSSKLDNKEILEKNIKKNYILNNDDNYINEDTENDIKIISKKIFIYPEYNKIGNKDPGLNKTDLPIELIMILRKFKDVNTLIFQIQNVDANYINLATFILANIDWLFIKDIVEVKFDINNEEIEKGLDKTYNLITENYYKKYKINKNKFFYNGIYSSRNINCWMPESDIFFTEEKRSLGDDCIYKTQITDDSVILKDYICNIYNAFGNLMNIKYIPKLNFSTKNQFKDHLLKQMFDMRTNNKYPDDDKKAKNLDSNIKKDFLNESISIFDINDEDDEYTYIKKNKDNNLLISNNSNLDIENIGKNYKEYFNMILIYSYYLGKYLKNIEKLSLYFENAFTFEINSINKVDVNTEYIHFLFLLNKLESIKDISFSFNSLDDKSFENILGLLNKNSGLSKLKISFFTPDINYYDNSLFDLCSSKKIDITQIFPEFRLYQMKHWKNRTKKINEYLLNEKLLNSFILNLCNLSNLLKLQLLKNLEELIFRFDIPIPLINNPEYTITIIKFLINLFIMITFQQNKTKTFKILASNLEFNGKKMPFLRTFFNEISLSKEAKININKINEDKINVKLETKELNNINKVNEQEKECELKIKNKNEIINKDETYSISSQEKNNENEYDTEINTNIENLENSNKSYNNNKTSIPKNTNEKAANRNELSENNNNNIASRKLNPNDYLENLVIQMKISHLPEIFNFCIINNLAGLKYINLGNLDEITFKGFVDDYKLNCNKLKNLISIKINLGFSVLSFDNIENYIFDFININTPKLIEKFLLTNLIINSEEKMKKLIDLVYLEANIEKIVVKLNYSNIDLLSKLLSQFFIEYKNKYLNNINSIVLLLNHPKFKNIYNKNILSNLCDLIIFNKSRTILCNEYS